MFEKIPISPLISCEFSINPGWDQLVAIVQPDAVLELGGGPHSPWMAPDKRGVLAEIFAQELRLKVR